MKTFLLSWGLVVLSALFDSYAAFIVKSQFNLLGKIEYSSLSSVLSYLSKFIKNPLLITAVITFIVAPVFWFFSLNRLDLSIAYPVLISFHLLFIIILSVFFLGENMTWFKIIGTALVFTSLFFFYYDN